MPLPSIFFWYVYTMCICIFATFNLAVKQCFLSMSANITQIGDSINSFYGKAKAVNFILYGKF